MTTQEKDFNDALHRWEESSIILSNTLKQLYPIGTRISYISDGRRTGQVAAYKMDRPTVLVIKPDRENSPWIDIAVDNPFNKVKKL